jgi:hypothetical protein
VHVESPVLRVVTKLDIISLRRISVDYISRIFDPNDAYIILKTLARKVASISSSMNVRGKVKCQRIGDATVAVKLT